MLKQTVAQKAVPKASSLAQTKLSIGMTGSLLLFHSINNTFTRLQASGSSSGNNQGGNNQSPQPENPNNQPNSSNSAVVSQDEKKEPKLNQYIDHTVLKAGTTWKDIQKVCDEARTYNFVAVCIPACFVKEAKQYLKGTIVEVATVIGFPLGHMTTEAKVFEATQAIKDGADEIDMVINIGHLKEGRNEAVLNEIKQIKQACGNHVLKVIIETCYLTEDEVRTVTQLVVNAGADFIKTSTGFGPRGASFRDVELFREVSKDIKIKAAGGVRDRYTAFQYIQMGVSRIGTSSGVSLMQTNSNNQTKTGSY